MSAGKLRYTHWQVFKIKAGRRRGRWCARNYSLAGGFTYDRKVFDSYTDALTYIGEQS